MSADIVLHRERPIFQAVMSLIAQTEKQIKGRLRQPVRLTLTGGAAMSFYSETRQSGDVDAVFSHAVSLPPILIEYVDEQHMHRKLVWDANYSPSIGLMHPDALQDAHHVGLSSAMKFDVFILSPLDLATSKLGRYAENDAADIKNLFSHGLISAKDLELRAIEALDYFIGDTDQVYHNIGFALESLGAQHTLPKPEYESTFSGQPDLIYNSAKRLDEDRCSDTPFHCLADGPVRGTVLTLCEDRSVAYLQNNDGIVAVYRSNYREMPELSSLHGIVVTLQEHQNQLVVTRTSDTVLQFSHNRLR